MNIDEYKKWLASSLTDKEKQCPPIPIALVNSHWLWKLEPDRLNQRANIIGWYQLFAGKSVLALITADKW